MGKLSANHYLDNTFIVNSKQTNILNFIQSTQQPPLTGYGPDFPFPSLSSRVESVCCINPACTRIHSVMEIDVYGYC